MPFRKTKGDKHSGIFEYYRSNDHDKATVAYYISYRDETGKSTGRVKIDAKTLKDALKTLNERKASASEIREHSSKSLDILHHRVKNNVLTFDEMAKLYYSSRTAKNNHMDERQYNNHLKPIIGRRKVSKFTTENVIELQTALLSKRIRKEGEDDGRTLSPKTVDNIINQLKSMFNEGKRDKNRWCLNNPVADKDVKALTQDEDKSRLRILTDNELQRLFELASVNQRTYLLMKLLYHTAARPDAIISLQVKDINFKQNKIHLKAMKKAKAYSVPIVEEIALLLKEWIEEHQLKYSHCIFYPIQSYNNAKTAKEKEELKKKHARYENFRLSAKSIIDEEFNADVPTTDRRNSVSLYTLRHTAATKLVKKLGIKVAKEYLNHSDLKVTEIYTKVDDDDLQAAAGVL